MDSVKAHIRGDGMDSSVEFSVEEVIANHRGKPWGEMNEEEREAAMKAYALRLFSRHSGMGISDDLQVRLEPGTFSKEHR